MAISLLSLFFSTRLLWLKSSFRVLYAYCAHSKSSVIRAKLDLEAALLDLGYRGVKMVKSEASSLVACPQL